MESGVGEEEEGGVAAVGVAAEREDATRAHRRRSLCLSRL